MVSLGKAVIIPSMKPRIDKVWGLLMGDSTGDSRTVTAYDQGISGIL